MEEREAGGFKSSWRRTGKSTWRRRDEKRRQKLEEEGQDLWEKRREQLEEEDNRRAIAEMEKWRVKQEDRRKQQL